METSSFRVTESPSLLVLEVLSLSESSLLQSPDILDVHGHHRMLCHWDPKILPVLASITVQHLVLLMARSPVAVDL